MKERYPLCSLANRISLLASALRRSRRFQTRESRLRYASRISRRNTSDPEARAEAHGTQLRIRGVAESAPAGASLTSLTGLTPPATRPTAARRATPATPRVALTIVEAATAIGISEASFRRHVLPHLRVVHAGPRLKLVRVVELDRWAQRHEALDAP